MNKSFKRRIKPITTLLFAFLMVFSSTAALANAATKYENNVPAIYQYNYTTTIVSNGYTTSVKQAGCGATSASMIIRYYTGDTSQTPETLFRWACNNGYYYGDGLSHKAIKDMSALYGVSCSWTNNTTNVVQAIKDGKPVIAHMGPGTFTSYGHYIVLTGYKIENNVEKVRVNDPNSSSRTGKYYNLSLITSEKRGSGEDFGICSYVAPGTPSTLTVAPTLATTSITQGNSCNISGTVSSNYLLKSVEGSIINSAGTAVQKKSIVPNSTSVSLYSSAINSNLKFGSLAAGNYTLRITATDASAKTVTKNISFTVKGVTSTLTVSPTLASTTINLGYACRIAGTVTSNYKITNVTGSIKNSSGTTVQTQSIAPNSTSVSLADTAINSNLKFGQLAAGNYSLVITAKDSSGASKSKTISFTIKGTTSTLTVSPSIASTTIQQGYGCNILGTVTSNYSITKIEGVFVNSSGTTLQRATISPNSTSVTLKDTAINMNLKFGSLAKGNYTLKVTATDSSGTTKTATRNFTIK